MHLVRRPTARLEDFTPELVELAEEVLEDDDDETWEQKEAVNKEIERKKIKFQARKAFFEYQVWILKSHPDEDRYVLTKMFWDQERLNRQINMDDPNEVRSKGELISYVFMQVMLRRELTSRLTYPDGKFRRFLNIPRMEVKTLNISFRNKDNAAPYMKLADRLRFKTGLEFVERNRTFIKYLYKAMLCPMS